MTEKKWAILSVSVAVVLIFAIAMLFTNSAKTETRQAQIDKQFSAWDGSHHELTKRIKVSMHDPASYQHVKTTYVDSEQYLIVTTTFRGKNAFGGMVKNTVKAKVTVSGIVIEILKE